MKKITMPDSTPEVIYDPSNYCRSSRPGASADGRSNFKSTDLSVKTLSRESTNQQENVNEELDINKLLKDIQYLGSSNMTWKERKKLENERVVALGGKAPKKHRVPLSVGKVQFKNRKKREEKRIEEEQILGIFMKQSSSHRVQKRKAEDGVLKASEGHFSRGVLNVKHLLERKKPGSSDPSPGMHGKVKKKGKGKAKGKGQGRRKRN